MYLEDDRMINKTIEMNVKGSLPGAKLVTYVQEYTGSIGIDKRPFIIICPGGGYKGTSDREAECMALQFLAMGYHAGVLRYSCAPARFPTALTELAYSVMLIREHAEEWHVDTNKIIVQGCSAGGHLAASLGVFWDEEFLAVQLGLDVKQSHIIRPDGMILCYPVITTGEFANKGSFVNLLDDKEELLEKMSLEKQVSSKTPKAFIWHTFEDSCVPVENSLLLVSALRKSAIPTEFHMYPKGKHGLALANHLTATADGDFIQEECNSWIQLVHSWLDHLD